MTVTCLTHSCHMTLQVAMVSQRTMGWMTHAQTSHPSQLFRGFVMLASLGSSLLCVFFVVGGGGGDNFSSTKVWWGSVECFRT